jgi:RNA polymerase sigma-70 factor (ECF subfamily)
MADVMEAARQGDEAAFAALVEPHRRELRALCYRMLGSVDDADDALQEILVRAWRGLPRFEGRSSLRTWLYRIATNACLNRLERRPARTVPFDFGPAAAPGEGPGELLDEALWLGPYPDRFLADEDTGPEAAALRAESVELAFVAALQRLPSRARAVLILRSVLDYPAQETADMLGISVAAANSILQRARSTLRSQVPSRSQQATVRDLGDERVRDLVTRYARAIETADVDGLLALLSEDATWAMPPMPAWYRGKEAIRGFLLDYPLRHRWRHLPARANGQPALGCYAWDRREHAYLATALDVLTLDGDRITAVMGFVDPKAVALCGLPARLPAGTAPAGWPA